MKTFLILITAAISLVHLADAQSAGKRVCRIVYPERPNDAPKVAYFFDGKENHSVTLPSMNFSDLITLPSGDLTLVMTPTEITDPETIPQNIPMLRIAEDITDFYILVTPDASNPTLPVRMNLVNMSDGKLKPGETLWFNLTEHRIVARLGEDRMSVTSKSQTVSKSPRSGSGYYRAEIGYQPQSEGPLQRITEQQWWHDEKSRHVGFIVNTGGKLPKIYYYRDFR